MELPNIISLRAFGPKTGALQQGDIKTHIGAMTVGDAGGAMVLGPSDDGRGLIIYAAVRLAAIMRCAHITTMNTAICRLIWIWAASVQ